MNQKIKHYFGLGAFLLLAAGFSLGTTYVESSAKTTVKPKKIQLRGTAADKSGISLEVGKKGQISYTVLPKTAANKKVTFSSSNKKVATVSKKGVISGVKQGSAVITVQSAATKSVKKKVKVKISKPQEDTVSARASTYQASQMSLTSLASTADVAPLGSGETVLSSEITTYLASSTAAVTGLTITPTTLSLPAGESAELTATVLPVTSTEKVSWSVSPRGGINVYSTGNVFITEDTPIGTTATVTATCGKYSATCVVTVVQGPCEHVWGNWAVTVAPECMVEGVERSICSKCSKTRERAVAATGHSWIGKVLQEPTCTEVGEREYVCQNCGETKNEVIKENGHTWSANGTILEEPTCTKTGKKEFTCTVAGCDGTKTETIPANGHTWDNGEVTKNPGCDSKGTRTYHCTVDGCNGTKKETIAATGHTWTWGEVTAEATCEKDGSRVITCLSCGKTSKESIAKLGHDDDAGTVTKEATCEESGETTYVCARCGRIRVNRKLPEAMGHNYADPADPASFTVDKEPNCTKTGKKSIHCTNTWHDTKGNVVACTSKTEITDVPALGHAYKQEIIQQQDCELPEITKTTCTRDGCTYQKKTNTKAAAGHNWGDPDNPVYTTDKEPTCTAYGRESIHCQNVWNGVACSEHKKSRAIDMIDHNNWANADVVQKQDPTCNQDGYVVYKCKIVSTVDGVATVCGKTKQISLPALGHSYSGWTTDITPTCTTAGEKSKHCTNTWTDANGKTVSCTERDEITAIEPLAHKWSGWVTKQQPTHDTLGYQEKTCTDCGATQKMSLSGGHNYDSNGQCQACSRSLTLTVTTASDWDYKLDETAGTILLKKYNGTNTCIKIPAQMAVTVNGVTKNYDVTFDDGYEARTQTGLFASNKYGVQAVSFENGVKLTNMRYMFYGCESLEVVMNIPSTVTNMVGTFKGCTSLVTVSALPSGLTSLESTFQDCKKLSSAPTIPSTVTNMRYTFKNCEMLTTAPTLPPNVEDLGWTFSGCVGISDAPTLPGTVTNMTNTFESSGLLEVPANIPTSVTKLTMTFYGCEQLDRVTQIPSGVVTMEYTFKNCKNLVYATRIPSTVTRQVDVFVGCDKLK